MKFNKRFSLAMGIFLTVALLVGCSTAPKEMVTQEAPAKSWKRFHTIVDAQFVKGQIQMPMPEDVMLIDARPFKPKYYKGHIPMAVNIPFSKMDTMMGQLPENKEALLVYYCEGPKCKLSHLSAWKAEKAGYKNVKVYEDGFPGWMKVAGNYPSVAAEWVKKQIDNKTDMVLVDSRPKRKKYDKGHIPTATSIPDMSFDKMVDQLPADKDKLMVFYCGGFKCKLSHKFAAKAIDMGYTNVKVFSAGYPAWKKIAKKGSTATVAPAKVKAGAEEGSIDIADFQKLISESPDSLMVVDVRDADEFAQGTIPGAVNISVDDLEGKIASLPTNKPVVFICGTGARAGESFYMVQDLRAEMKNVYYVDGEITFKKDGSYTIKPAS